VHRSSIDPDLAVLARRERTLVVAVTTTSDEQEHEHVRVLLDACATAGVATRTVARGAANGTLAPRTGVIDRVLVFGSPVETAVLQVALGLGAHVRTVGIIWDACAGESELTVGLTRDRATQAGVIPYTRAALVGELGLALADRAPRRFSEVA
jgi:hypothetical protein